LQNNLCRSLVAKTPVNAIASTTHLIDLSQRFKIVFIAALSALLIACGGGAGSSSDTGNGSSSPNSNSPSNSSPRGNLIPPPITGAPYVLYTDIVSGPNSGGENGKGTYLSIFGKNFGSSGLGTSVKVYIGDVEVDNYRYLGVSQGRADIGQLTVQVGALGNASTGVALPIRVVVNGVNSNTNHTFMIQPGDILFVDNVSGNDATALKSDINRPWRYVQTPSEGGALAQAGPGDVIVLRGKAVWSDVGFESHWFRFRRTAGSAPTGATGTGYIAVMAYPGEAVRYVPPGGTHGGIHGTSDWIVISGLRIESAASSLSDGAPINLQANSDHWRVVNNDVGPWPASSSAGDKAAGIAGNGKNNTILGNYVHDIGGGTLNHGMYFDTGTTDLEVAYNEVANVGQGNLIQTFDNLGTGDLNNLSIHHNLLHDGGRYGLNISTGTNSLSAWNNVIYNTALAGVRFSVQTNASSAIAILNNTLYNNGTSSGAPITNDWNLYAGTALFANNIVVAGPGTASSSYYNGGGNDSALQIQRNLWYGLNRGGAPSQDSDPVGGLTDLLNPLFANAASGNLKLLAGSPAIDQAATVPFTVIDDYQQTARPQGGRADVGAYEFR